MQEESIPPALMEFLKQLPAEDNSHYAEQQKSMAAPANDIKKALAEERKCKIEPTCLWQLVKNLEEKSDRQIQQLNEMVATLLANFSEHNKGRHPVLISDKDTPLAMLIRVLEYYVTAHEAKI